MSTILRCGQKRKARAVYCANHARDVAALKYQSDKAGELGFFDELAADAERLTLALEEFDRVNPKGRFRKQLIDWTQFKKRFKVTTAVTHRRAREEWTWTDHQEEKEGRGWEQERIKAGWQKLLDSDYERTGDGFHASIWVPKRRERMADETRAIDNEIEQASKAVKNLKNNDLEALKDFVESSGSHPKFNPFVRLKMKLALNPVVIAKMWKIH